MTSRSRGLDPFGLNVEDKLHSEKDWSGLNFAGMIGLTNIVLGPKTHHCVVESPLEVR